MRYVTPDWLAQIKRFEGFRATPYFDAAGLKTIGYGHLLRDSDTLAEVTEDQATGLLVQDIGRAERAVLRLIKVPLSDGQFDALVDFCFNLGGGALQRSTLRQMVNRGDLVDAPAEFEKWCRAAGRRITGLVIRRRIEAMRFQGEG